jgi:hypothetical protein
LKVTASGGRSPTDQLSQKDGHLLYRTRCPSPSSISPSVGDEVSSWRIQQFLRKILMSAEEMKCYTDRRFSGFYFTKPDLDVSYQKFKTSEASSSSACCCCNSDWRQKHKQCSMRVSLLDVNDFDECKINQIRGDNKVGRQLESVHLEPEISN